MSKSRRKFTKEFKEEAVKYALNSSKTIQEIADSLGIHYNLLSRWKREYLESKEKAFPGHGNPRDEELYRLKKEIADLKMENEILKKATVIFSREK